MIFCFEFYDLEEFFYLDCKIQKKTLVGQVQKERTGCKKKCPKLDCKVGLGLWHKLMEGTCHCWRENASKKQMFLSVSVAGVVAY